MKFPKQEPPVVISKEKPQYMFWYFNLLDCTEPLKSFSHIFNKSIRAGSREPKSSVASNRFERENVNFALMEVSFVPTGSILTSQTDAQPVHILLQKSVA